MPLRAGRVHRPARRGAGDDDDGFSRSGRQPRPNPLHAHPLGGDQLPGRTAGGTLHNIIILVWPVDWGGTSVSVGSLCARTGLRNRRARSVHERAGDRGESRPLAGTSGRPAMPSYLRLCCLTCISAMPPRGLPKLRTRVRFPSPAFFYTIRVIVT